MAIADQLTQLSQVKTDIKQALIAKGVDVTDVPFTGYGEKVAELSGGGQTFVSVITSGNANTPTPLIKECNCALNRVVWCLYIQKGGDDRSFYHYCRISTSTDNGSTYKEAYYGSIQAVNGAVSTGSFNPEGMIYTHIKIEIWNGTVYNCAGCAIVYYEKVAN